jgi:hypothetical protein
MIPENFHLANDIRVRLELAIIRATSRPPRLTPREKAENNRRWAAHMRRMGGYIDAAIGTAKLRPKRQD